jgi:hypothetical protein
VKPWQAVASGHLLTTTMALAVMPAPIVIVALAGEAGYFDALPGLVQLAIAIIALMAGGLASWLTWAWLITRWRLWAYRRVSDIAALKRSAEGTLIWPEGHVFERSEIRSSQQRKELARLETASLSERQNRPEI